MPDSKDVEKKTKSSPNPVAVDPLLKVLPTTTDFKDAGFPSDSPDPRVWLAELKKVKQTDVRNLDPVRVEIAVQRVMIGVIKSMLKSNPDMDASDLRRRTTSLIPSITGTIVGK
jgi:hypothetical protein